MKVAFATGSKTEGKDNHRCYKKKKTQGKHSTTLSLQSLRSGICKGQLLQPWAETRAAYCTHAISSTHITAPFYFLDGGGMILLVIQILTDLTRIL